MHLTRKHNESTHTLDEQLELFKWITEDIKDREVDAILVAGDVFDGPTTPTERNAAIEVFRQFATHCQVAICRGNHDQIGDLNYLGQIHSKYAILVYDQPRICHFGFGPKMAVLPWPTRASIANTVAAQSLDAIDAAATSALQAVLTWFRSEEPDILLSHCEIGSALMSSGQPVTGRADFELSTHDLFDIGASYCALGHIHDQQSWSSLDRHIRYAGSVRQTFFGGHVCPGYTIIDTGHNHMVDYIGHVEVPVRRLVTVGLDTVTLQPQSENPGTPQAYKIKYETTQDSREADYKKAQQKRDLLLSGGAHSVVIEPKIKLTERVRSTTIAEVSTIKDQVEATWQATSRPKRGDQILEKLREIEEGEINES
jgi:DNA repair exonuclease SbcCD nuclease subunit